MSREVGEVRQATGITGGGATADWRPGSTGTARRRVTTRPVGCAPKTCVEAARRANLDVEGDLSMVTGGFSAGQCIGPAGNLAAK